MEIGALLLSEPFDRRKCRRRLAEEYQEASVESCAEQCPFNRVNASRLPVTERKLSPVDIASGRERLLEADYGPSDSASQLPLPTIPVGIVAGRDNLITIAARSNVESAGPRPRTS